MYEDTVQLGMQFKVSLLKYLLIYLLFNVV